MKSALIAIFFALLSLSATRADDWQRADVYFVDWYVSSRIPLTLERVRKLAEHKHIFRRDAPAVARLLELTKLKPAEDKTQEDARLVIDLLDDTMQRQTFYASMFNLCSADNKRKRAIGDKFRQRLTQLATQQKPNDGSVQRSCNAQGTLRPDGEASPAAFASMRAVLACTARMAATTAPACA